MWDLVGTTSPLGGHFVKATPPNDSHPNPSPFIPTWINLTNISKIGKTAKSAPKIMVCPKKNPVSKTKKPAMYRMPSQSRTKDLVVPNLHIQLPIGEIFDLLDNLPLNVCVEFTHNIFTSVRTAPSGLARSGLSLKPLSSL